MAALKIGVVMGSQSDWPIMEHAVKQLEAFGVAYETRVVSAHRTPDLLFEYAVSARANGLACIIAGAGGAAHLPGMLAAKTTVPVLGVPIPSPYLKGMDSLLSIAQMPKGVPVATFAIGEAGAANAALYAISILAVHDADLAARLDAFRHEQEATVLAMSLPPEGLITQIMRMILPGATLGVLGGGQLGRMFCAAARTMGYRIAVLDPDPNSPAGQLADHHILANYHDSDALDKLAALCDVVTTEFENVPAQSMRQLASECAVFPAPEALEIAQNRNREKQYALEAGLLPVPNVALNDESQLQAALAEIGLPAILKSATLGYDGKGQVVVNTEAELHEAWHSMGQVECVLEKKIDLALEVSAIVARNDNGATCFPVAENQHRNGVLHISIVPARAAHSIIASGACPGIAAGRSVELYRCARGGVFCRQRRDAVFQRNGAAPAQQRPLHQGCLCHLAVRAAGAHDLWPAAR